MKIDPGNITSFIINLRKYLTINQKNSKRDNS